MAFRVGILAVIGGILISIMVGVYAFDQAKTVPVYAVAGELIQVGPVSYVIEYDAMHKGNEITNPEYSYYQIKIHAKNTGSEKTRISNSQFSMTSENLAKKSPVYSNFSSTDLSGLELEPGTIRRLFAYRLNLIPYRDYAYVPTVYL